MAFEKQIDLIEQQGKKEGKGGAAGKSPKKPKKLSKKQKKLLEEKKKTGDIRQLLDEERIYQRGVISVRDLIAPASFEVNSNHLILGDQYVRTLFIVSYPRYVGVGWAAPIINFNWTLDIGMFFYPIESANILKQLKKKAGEVEAQLGIGARDGAAGH